MGKRFPRRGFAYSIGLLSCSLETGSQCHCKQLSSVQENLPFETGLLILFCFLPHQDVLSKHQYYLLLVVPSNDYLAPPEVELFLQTGWCKIGWKPVMVETPLSPANLAVAPNPGLTPEQAIHFLLLFLVLSSLTYAVL